MLRLSRPLSRSLRLVRHASVAPGIPPQATPNPPVSQNFLANVEIPKASIPDPEPPVQIPFVPDFWDSSRTKQSTAQPAEDDLPKLVVISGAASHPVGGASHELLDAGEPIGLDSSAPKAEFGKGGLLDDMVEDLGITLSEIKSSLPKFFS